MWEMRNGAGCSGCASAIALATVVGLRCEGVVRCVGIKGGDPL